jgi:predicted AAA+ superfamily ATPase
MISIEWITISSKYTLGVYFELIVAKYALGVYFESMAHDRKRHIHPLFDSLLKFSPIIGLFGHRQVGKSTFVSSVVKEYRTLDDFETLAQARSHPKKFIESRKMTPMAIDECQLEPLLFPTLKEWVRIHKRPGQFVLSGSVRFTSRKAIRESLAGRMATLEMYPLSIVEIAELPLSNTILTLLSHTIFSTDSFRYMNPKAYLEKLEKAFVLYLEHGGLPGICFIRNPTIKKSTLNELHDLMLGRDLQLISDFRTPAISIKNLLAYIAELGFKPYNASSVSRKLGLAAATQKNILFALESIFLIRRIPFSKGKKEIVLLEDQFEEKVYGRSKLNSVELAETAVYRNIRSQLGYQLDKTSTIESYLTRNGARVPIVIRNETKVLGIIVTEGETPSLSEIRSGASFLKNYATSKILYLTQKRFEPKVLDERSMHCSIFSVI